MIILHSVKCDVKRLMFLTVSSLTVKIESIKNFKSIRKHLQAHGERQRSTVKLLSIKYLKSQYSLKFPVIKFLHKKIILWSNDLYMYCMC